MSTWYFRWDMVKLLVERKANPLVRREEKTVFECCHESQALAIMVEGLHGVPCGQVLRIAEHALNCGSHDVTIWQWVGARLQARPTWPIKPMLEIAVAAAIGDQSTVMNM